MKSILMQQIAVLTVVMLAIGTAMTGCGGGQTSVQEPSAVVGASEEARQTLVLLVPPETSALFKKLAKIVERSGLSYEFQMMEGGTQAAQMQAIRDGKVDLALVMRRPRPNEPLAFLELFFTPIVIFVNAGVGVDALTREQAAAIFSGQITNWSQVGGDDLEIRVFVQEEDDTATSSLKAYLFDTETFAESAQVLFNDKDVISVVSGLAGSIGYSPWATKRFYDQVLSGNAAVLVSLDGCRPDNPRYPVAGVVGFAYLPERQAELQPLLDWAISFLDSEIGQALLDQYGASVVSIEQSESAGYAPQD